MGCTTTKPDINYSQTSEYEEKHDSISSKLEQPTYSNQGNFIPLFTTKTSTAVYGYVRLIFDENNINTIIPTDLIDIIYKFMKNNCSFIIIFENDIHPQHSYLHEIDIESGTNINLSTTYQHNNHIWKRIEKASYCYGEYNDKNAIFRIGGEQQTVPSIGCIVKSGKIFELPELQISDSQVIYSKNYGLFVIGGWKQGNIVGDISYLNEKQNKWEQSMDPMIEERKDFLSVFHESHHSNISDKIYCLGGAMRVPTAYWGIRTQDMLQSMEYFDFKSRKWHKMNDMNYKRSKCGGCIDIETDKLVIVGGDGNALIGKSVEEFDFVKQEWYQIGGRYGYTNYSHCHYPKVSKHNKVIVVFGNNGYSKHHKDYGYVEYFDQRSSQNKWVVTSSLRQLLQLTGNQVRSGFYQHMVQL